MRDWPSEMMTQTGCWCSKWVTRSQSQSSRDQAQALTRKTVQRQSQRLSAGPESTGEAESKQSYSKGRSGKWKGGRGGWIEETWLVTLSMNSRGWQRRTRAFTGGGRVTCGWITIVYKLGTQSMLSFSPKWAKCSFSSLLHGNLLCWML